MTVILGTPGGSTTPPGGGGPGPGTGTPPTPRPPRVVPQPSFGGFTLSSSRGTVALQGTVEALQGWQGLGPVQRRANTRDPLGIDGVIINRRRPVKRSGRQMTGPVHIQADTPRQRAIEARELLNVLSPLDDGPITFTASIETGEVVTGECWAQFDGGDEWAAVAAYDTRAVLELDLLFPDPRLFGETRRTRQGVNTSAPFFPIGPVVLTDSTAFGDLLTVDVGGDLSAHAVWRWTGPGTLLTVTGSGGQVWQVDPPPLLSGQTVTVTTDLRAASEGASRVLGPAGQDYWQYLTRRSLFPLAPGTDTVTIDVEGTGTGSDVSLEWRPAIEAIL